MATKKEQRELDTVHTSAARYIELKKQVDELTKEMNLHKKVCTDHAKKIGAESLEIGDLKVDRRTSVKGIIDKALVDPHWLWEVQEGGYMDMLDINIDYKQIPEVQGDTLARLLKQVNFEEKESVTYAVRL